MHMHSVYQYSSTFFSLHMQWGNTALLRAAYGGNVNLVRMLLEEFDSSLDELNTVSDCAPICSTIPGIW